MISTSPVSLEVPSPWRESEEICGYLSNLNNRFLAQEASIQRLSSGLFSKNVATPEYPAGSGSGWPPAPGSITTDMLANNAVVGIKVLDGIITELKLANAAVTEAKIAVSAVTTTKIADDAVTTPKIIAGAVQTNSLAAGAVTALKLASLAVTTDKLDALAITSDKIAANAVIAGKIATGAVYLSNLNFIPVLSTNVIASINATTEGLLISAALLQIDGTTVFASGYNPSTKITAGGAAADINANATTISGGKITTNSITADRLNVTSLSAVSANLGTVTAGSINLSSGLDLVVMQSGLIQQGNISLYHSGGESIFKVNSLMSNTAIKIYGYSVGVPVLLSLEESGAVQGSMTSNGKINLRPGANSEITSLDVATYVSVFQNRNNSADRNGVLASVNWAAATATILNCGQTDATTGVFSRKFAITGDGYMHYGVYSAASLSVTGYVEIYDRAGTLRRLLVG